MKRFFTTQGLLNSEREETDQEVYGETIYT